VKHVCDLAGNAQHVALGTDMDGGLGRDQIPVEVKTIADLRRVADALSNANFGDTAIRQIMGENWSRFFRANLGEARTA
jgi:membrane dipeptidase